MFGRLGFEGAQRGALLDAMQRKGVLKLGGCPVVVGRWGMGSCHLLLLPNGCTKMFGSPTRDLQKSFRQLVEGFFRKVPV